MRGKTLPLVALLYSFLSAPLCLAGGPTMPGPGLTRHAAGELRRLRAGQVESSIHVVGILRHRRSAGATKRLRV